MSDPIKVIIDGKEQEVFLKDDVVLKSDYEKTQRELEDVRMEVLTPQYDEFLKSLDTTPVKKNVVKEEVNEDEFKGLTPKQIYEKALAAAEAKIEEKLSAREGESAAQEAARVKREIAAFAKTHADYETYRKIMHGFALDPAYADMNINQLYEAAKDYVKTVQTGSTDAQKEKSRQSSGMKPGNDSESFIKLKATSNEQIGRDALEETKAALGPIPLA